jgi:hypothetical protein
MIKIYKPLITIVLLLITINLSAQTDSTSNSQQKDTITNQDAIYSRPFINLGRSTTAVGGYLEANTNYFVTDGVKEGYSMEMRRFNIFLYSTIFKRIKFLSELEFEGGTKEISLETALVDFELDPAFTIRMGILLAPIGGFNQNHDAPKWEFVNRPLVSTTMIPSTLSEIGFGAHGKFYPGNLVFTYDFYLVNGLRDGVILNNAGKTFLPFGKSDEMFEEDNNGTPMYTGKIGIRHRNIGEIGFSYYGGIYNKFAVEGVSVQPKRSLHLMAFDFNTTIKKKLYITGEIATDRTEVPSAISELFGTRQWGAFTDFVYPVLRKKMLRFPNAVLNVNVRLERVDYNVGKFKSDGSKIYDEVTGGIFGLSFRPTANTVIRANYLRYWTRDLAGNPAVKTGGIQVGFASYF